VIEELAAVRIKNTSLNSSRYGLFHKKFLFPPIRVVIFQKVYIIL
jgi:hypothetical protein